MVSSSLDVGQILSCVASTTRAIVHRFDLLYELNFDGEDSENIATGLFTSVEFGVTANARDEAAAQGVFIDPRI